MHDSNFPTAELEDDLLNKIKALEVDLRNTTHRQVVLVAYNKEDE